MKIKRVFLSLMMATMLLAGCNKQQSNPVGEPEIQKPTPAQTVTQEATTEVPTEPPTKAPSVVEGMERSPLTGLWVTPEAAGRRPFAVMINNVKEAIPQSGIARTEVLYETYVEGNITRLLMVTQDYDGLEKIGPIRSCREFYIFFAKEYEAAYVHFGRSILAIEQLAKPESNSMDGNYNEYATFRSTDRVAPHNAYSTTAGILGGMAKKGISVELPKDFTQPLKFNVFDDEEINIEGGRACTTFKPGFSYNKPELVYNEEDGLYYRYQFGEKHVDMETGEQLTFKNILVKYVDSHLFDNYTPVLNLEGSGSGLFITNGQAIDVTWKKDDKLGATTYYYPNGEEIVLNQGRVMVCVIHNTDRDSVEIQ